MVALPYAGTFSLSQRFGSNTAAYKRFGMLGHNGIDVALPSGTPLIACVAGVATERRSDPTGYGLYTVLTDAAGNEWLYGHGSSWSIKEGQRVDEGQRIGRSGNTGNSTGPHLHFGYRPFGYDRSNGYLGYANPRPFLPIPYRVLLQEGHVGAQPASGAPREAEWTGWIAPMIAAKLRAAGVETAFIGDFYNGPDAAEAKLLEQDWDVMWAIHYDAAVYGATTGNTGCCIARGTAETEWWEADRLLSHWTGRYPALTKIPLHQERVNRNMSEYYGLRYLSYVTPGIVVEHGVGAPGAGLDAPILWGAPDEVAAADAVAILKWLHLPPTTTMEPSIMAILNDEELYTVLNNGWQQLCSPVVPCNRESAIYKAIVERGRAEKKWPLPLAPEFDHGFGVSQWFRDGTLAVYKAGSVSWSG